ncbi:uncharacterized protein LOC108670627 [Hyalella azteca]|uniref:Uncharacterized protein LOC108670627 n=1 Tax=Hyalella azteca TaxID=294128 RepID=A0A8B7NJU3_HYAAZ|nr:uncharacterized protein LOC108670627 [Hyalella azteca]
MDGWNYLQKRKTIVVTGLPGNEDDSEFSKRVWLAVLGTASRGGRCDVQLLTSALQGQPRDCLFTPGRRQEFVSALVPLFEAKDNIEENVGSFLIAVQQFHNAALASNNGICRLGHPHALLYVAAGVALQYKLENSSHVCTLLKSIHKCDGGLDKVFIPPLLGHRLTHVLSGWRPHQKDGDNPKNLLFWVIHGTCVGLKVGSPPKKIQDAPMPSLQNTVPLTIAIQADNVQAVKYLLMCGADAHTASRNSPLLAVLSKLSAHARATLATRPTCDCFSYPDPENGSRLSAHEMGHCLKLCPCELQWPIKWPPACVEILKRLMSCVVVRRLPSNADIVHPRIVNDGLIPAPTLKGMCRVVIRRQLSSSWNLPHGVTKLPIPTKLRQYIALQEDA